MYGGMLWGCLQKYGGGGSSPASQYVGRKAEFTRGECLSISGVYSSVHVTNVPRGFCPVIM